MKCLRLHSVIILIVGVILTGCGDNQFLNIYRPSEAEDKLDSKSGRETFIGNTPTIEEVRKEKRKDIKSSYKLLDGINDLKMLDIVKFAELNKDKINIELIAKPREMGNNSIKDILLDNTLFLLYTIHDTFPKVDKIRLYSNYYYMDKYGNPYKEIIYRVNTERIVVEKISREYFRPDMLSGIVDMYISESIEKKSKE